MSKATTLTGLQWTILEAVGDGKLFYDRLYMHYRIEGDGYNCDSTVKALVRRELIEDRWAYGKRTAHLTYAGQQALENRYKR